VLFLSCACVSVSGGLFSVGVCVCDLLILLHRDVHRHPKTTGPDDKKTVKKHSKVSIRGHPAFISLQGNRLKLPARPGASVGGAHPTC